MKHYWPTQEERTTPGEEPGSIEMTCERDGCTCRRIVRRGGTSQYATDVAAPWSSKVPPCTGGKRIDKPVVPSDDAGWVDLGRIARDRLSMQCQYASHYVDGRNDSPHLGEGLRFRSRSRLTRGTHVRRYLGLAQA